jgi:hypothetical protein
MVLDSIRDRHEYTDRPLNVLLFSGGGRAALTVAVCDNRTDKIAYTGCDCVHAIATVPESIVGCLIAEHEHQTHDDRQRRNLELLSAKHSHNATQETIITYNAIWQTNCIEYILVKVDHERRKQRMQAHWHQNRSVDSTLDEPENQRPSKQLNID